MQPPRLGGKENVGVFATRSTFRPNPLGMSVVENLGWEQSGSSLILQVGGVDLLNDTPIVDIKPYIPYADALTDAEAGFAETSPTSDFEIKFSPTAEKTLDDLKTDYPELRAFIKAVLKQDPRPVWRKKAIDEKRYGMTLYDLNIKWQIQENQIKVLSINPES